MLSNLSCYMYLYVDKPSPLTVDDVQGHAGVGHHCRPARVLSRVLSPGLPDGQRAHGGALSDVLSRGELDPGSSDVTKVRLRVRGGRFQAFPVAQPFDEERRLQRLGHHAL